MSREATGSGVTVRVSAKRQARIGEVERLEARLRNAKSLILTEYRGLTVAEITELRRALRGGSAEYRVIKNSLTQRAADALGIRGLAPYLVGPTAVAFTSGDPVAAAKILTAFSKRTPVLQVKAGLVDGRVLPREEILAMAELPPREVMVARLMGIMVAPLRGLGAVLSGSLRAMVVGLDQVRQKKEGSAG
ncbi:MAG: 50S ribosomal protein L10 [Candidatus Methylomirabilales bacterium]